MQILLDVVKGADNMIKDLYREQQINEAEGTFEAGQVPKKYLECERKKTFLLLILIAGIYGAYTYTLKGGIFCNAQTANFVLLSMALGNQKWMEAIYLLIPISAYFLGTIISEVVAVHIKKLHILRWDTLLIGIEIIVVIVLGALPASVPDQICQVALNFICSMQFNTFRQAEGMPMATTFCTNHVRQIGSSLVKYYRHHDEESKAKCQMHGSMLLFFLIGGIICVIFCRLFSVRAIWVALVFLVFLFIRLMIADLTYEKDLLERVPKGH